MSDRAFAPNYSKLAEEIWLTREEEKQAVKKLEANFKAKIKALEDKCTHKYDDGTDATHNERWGYNDYHDICEICGHDVTPKRPSLEVKLALKAGKKYPYEVESCAECVWYGLNSQYPTTCACKDKLIEDATKKNC